MPAVYGCGTTSVPAHSLSWESITFTTAIFKSTIQKTRGLGCGIGVKLYGLSICSMQRTIEDVKLAKGATGNIRDRQGDSSKV